MNIEQAKTIQIFNLMHKLGFIPSTKRGNEYCYSSPFREEETPSFQLNIDKNLWYDFGEVAGGDIICFATKYLQSHGQPYTVSDGLKWLDSQDSFAELTIRHKEKTRPKAKTELRAVKKLSNKALYSYLESRGISLEVADQYLKEVRLFFPETGKSMYALGFENEESGFAIRNSIYKGVFPPNHISFCKGGVKPKLIHIFEGFMDFLSVLSIQKCTNLNADSIILNSTKNIEKIKPYIQGYGYTAMYSWMDNDEAGNKAQTFLQTFAETEQGLVHKPLNKYYHGWNDINSWHMAKLGLPPIVT